VHTLDQHIISVYRGIVGRVPLEQYPAFEDYLDAFAADPAMLAAARAEKARLEQLIAARSQGQTHIVEEERRRLQALTMMLSRFEAAQGEKALNV
jgi:hypothetical protein